jgi:hypothetical protein
LQDASSPEAIAAHREGIAEAILLIGLREATTPAFGAGRKLEGLHPGTEGRIARVLPDLLQVFVADIPQAIAPDLLIAAKDIAAVGMHQSQAGAHLPIPGNSQVSLIDETTVGLARPAGVKQRGLVAPKPQELEERAIALLAQLDLGQENPDEVVKGLGANDSPGGERRGRNHGAVVIENLILHLFGMRKQVI